MSRITKSQSPNFIDRISDTKKGSSTSSPKPKDSSSTVRGVRDQQQIFMFKKLETDSVCHVCFKWLIDYQNSQRLIYFQSFNRPVVAALITEIVSLCWRKHPANTGRICSGLVLFEDEIITSCSWWYEWVFGLLVVEVLQLVFVGSGAGGGCAAIDVRGVYSRKVQIEAVFRLNEGGMAGGVLEPTHLVSW